jgi:hypothetical protein
MTARTPQDMLQGSKYWKPLSDVFLDVKKAQEFWNKEKIMQKVLNMSVPERIALGIPKSTLSEMRKRIRETGDLNLNTQVVRRLV